MMEHKKRMLQFLVLVLNRSLWSGKATLFDDRIEIEIDNEIYELTITKKRK